MAGKETKLDILVGVQGTEKLRGLTSSLKRLKDNSTLAGKESKKLLVNLQQQKKTATQTISGTRSLSNSYRQLANSVKIGSREFKIATARAEQLERRLRKLNTTAKKGKGGLGNLAKIGGTVAAAGVFGGAEGAIGSAIGGAFGGVAGAAVGGAVGAQVGQVTGAVAEIAKYDAALEKQRKALKLVIGDTDKYNKAQEFLAKTSKELAIPQDVIVRQFTSLTASVKGAGLSVDDAQDSFLAIASGIRGTGGSLEDMKSAMRATSQVFSKGKVSAEELRQQLGERLPGAFTLFAASMDKTPAELDKALEQGKVTLDDFLGFSEKLFSEYGENAKILAQAPESAGDRLQTEVSNLKDNVGDLLKPIGASFQTTFAEIVENINEATKALNRFLGVGTQNAIDKAQRDLERARQEIINARGKDSLDPITGERSNLQMERALLNYRNAIDNLSKLQTELGKTKTGVEELDDAGKTATNNLKIGMQSYLDSISDVNKQIQDATVNAFKKMEDALVNFVMTGKLNFKDFARSIIADITRIYVRQALITPLLGAFGLSPTPTPASTSAKGNIFDKNGLMKFAKGGIVTEPTYFQYGGAGKLGLMGEAGSPEAIMPLKRTSSGNLGVEAVGSGSTNVVVNVDASGSSVQGDDDKASQFGEAIAAAIQAEIVNQQMAGGLLT